MIEAVYPIAMIEAVYPILPLVGKKSNDNSTVDLCLLIFSLSKERNYIEIQTNKTASAGTIMKYVYGILSTVFQSYWMIVL